MEHFATPRAAQAKKQIALAHNSVALIDGYSSTDL